VSEEEREREGAREGRKEKGKGKAMEGVREQGKGSEGGRAGLKRKSERAS
jgi:hypothetical protein